MRCDRCGLESPEGFRFCGSCGAPLRSSEAVGLDRERKTISAVFCDLVGFTARAESLDPEDVHQLLEVYYERVRGEFEGFGGTIAKFIGDAVFVLFGAPRAHEDDPERAVRSALAALDAVAHLNAAHPELDLHLHIGVATGEVLVTFDFDEREGLAWGDILNTASRLEAAAPADGVLVDEATYRATQHVIEYRALEPIRAKGKAEPVPVWLPMAPLARLGQDTDAGRPLVDRQGELRPLLDALARARSSRTPQLVTLLGDPGIGKSCLVFQFFRLVDAAQELITWRQGRSPPYPEGVSFWAFGEIVKGQSGVLESDSAAVAATKLHHAVSVLILAPADADRIESHLRSLVGLGGAGQRRGDQREAAFAAWRHFVEALARRRPLVLVFEDIQWADDGLLDFIEHVVEWAHDVPLLIVCTARPELLDRRPRWSEQERSARLVVPPLSDAQARELVSLGAESAMPDAVTDAIVATSAGNPLYAMELVRMLVDRGVADGESLPLPGSLRGIIASRLDSLPVQDKALLQAGSAIGRAVWPGALAAITGRSRKSVVERLQALVDREFLTLSRSSSVEHEPEYRFQHVFMRDVAYGVIPRRRRGEIHRRTAEWLESLSPDRTADRAEMLAHHYLCAYKLASAAGHETAELARKARLALRDAGERVLGLHAFPAAARFFRAALELWPEDDEERPWLLLLLGRSVYYAETAGTDVLTEARDALLAAGDPGAAAEAEVFLANLAYHAGQRRPVFEHLDRAVALVEGLGPTASKAEVLVDLANYLSMAREHKRTIAAATEALEIAEQLDLREVQAVALSTIGISRGLSGDLGGRDDLRRGIEIAEEIGSHLSAQCSGMLADLDCNIGNLEACFELQARAREHAERFGHAGFVRWLAGERVGEGYWTGSWDEAVGAADALIGEAEAGAPNFMEGYCRAMRGRIRLARGDVQGALEDADGAVAFARSAEDRQTLYPALAFGARAAVAVGSRAEGTMLANELLSLWTKDIDAFPSSSWAVDLAYALDALGRAAELIQTASRVTTWTRWLGALDALLLGDAPTAASRFAEIGSRPDEALARLRAAAVLLAAGREDEAAPQLRRALTFFRSVGASAHLQEIEAIAGGAFVGETPSP